jgi:hypothetical protein
MGQALRFLERAHIDLIALFRNSRSDSEFKRAWLHAIRQAIIQNPSLNS